MPDAITNKKPENHRYGKWLKFARIFISPEVALPLFAFITGMTISIAFGAKRISVLFAAPIYLALTAGSLVILSIFLAARALREISRFDPGEAKSVLDKWVLRSTAAAGLILPLATALQGRHWLSSGWIFLVLILVLLYYFSPGLKENHFLRSVFRSLLLTIIPFFSGWVDLGTYPNLLQNFRDPAFLGLVLIIGFLQIGAELSFRPVEQPEPASRRNLLRAVFSSLPFLLLALGGKLGFIKARHNVDLFWLSQAAYVTAMAGEWARIKFYRKRQEGKLIRFFLIFLENRWGYFLMAIAFAIIWYCYAVKGASLF